MFTGSSRAIRLFLLLGGLLSVASGRQYTIVNNCPDPIQVYSPESWEAYLYPKTSFTKETGDNTYFYTSTNGGNSADEATRVGFYSGVLNQYYILKNWDSFNTGVRVQPNQAEINGFCPPVTCDAVTCTTAFVGYPNLDGPEDGKPPKPPLYSCPSPSNPNFSYTITFCPSGTFPGDNGRAAAIHPNNNPKKCMDVRGAVYADGTPVQIYDCNGTGAQKWIYSKGSTKIRVANTNYCLDAGTTPRNGVGKKIWTCYDNLPAQQWYTGTWDYLILEKSPGLQLCVDLPNGVLTNWNQLQVWECAKDNSNQFWRKGP